MHSAAYSNGIILSLNLLRTDRLTTAGCAFVCVDYRLIPPATGHEILEDVKDAIRYVAFNLNAELAKPGQGLGRISNFQIDCEAIAVAGTSAGGLCAYLAAMHATPKPRAVLSMYGMGGNFLTPHYLSPKNEVFFRGRELLNPNDFACYLHPGCHTLHPVSDSPLVYHLQSSTTPGYPANPRMLLTRLYLQLGTFLDYYTGCHEPSLSAALREPIAPLPADLVTAVDASQSQDEGATLQLKSAIPKRHIPLFPQLVASHVDWPPTILVHGSVDSAVPADESRHLHASLQRAGIEACLIIIAGEEHSFDYREGAEQRYGSPDGYFEQIVEFLINHLR